MNPCDNALPRSAITFTVRLTFSGACENQFAEVLVRGNQHRFGLEREGRDILIHQSRRKLGDIGDIVASRTEPLHDGTVEALISEY